MDWKTGTCRPCCALWSKMCHVIHSFRQTSQLGRWDLAERFENFAYNPLILFLWYPNSDLSEWLQLSVRFQYFTLMFFFLANKGGLALPNFTTQGGGNLKSRFTGRSIVSYHILVLGPVTGLSYDVGAVSVILYGSCHPRLAPNLEGSRRCQYYVTWLCA